MKVKVNISISGRSYPLTVDAEEETPLRRAGIKINDIIKEFETKYHVSDRQDALAMCALQIAAISESEKSESSEITELHLDRIAKINERITLALA